MTRHTVVVPGIETVAPPAVGLAAGAGAVWATTTAGWPLLRIDRGTARAASLSVPAQAVAADRSGRGRCAAKRAPAAGSSLASIRRPAGS